MSTSAPQEQAPEAQDQQTPPAPVAPLGDGPWANDLAALFTDEAIRSQVDQFLRQKVQPHTTQLEQKLAAQKDAANLWENFEKDPVATYKAISTELYGEEIGNQLNAQLDAALTQGQEPQAPQPGQPFDPSADPRIANALAWIEEQQTTSYYDSELARVGAEHPEIDTDLLHPFVAAKGGDFDAAVQLYTEWAAKMAPTPLTQALTETPPAPPALGSDTGASTSAAAPMEPKKQTLDEAINDFMSEQRASREAPPVLG